MRLIITLLIVISISDVYSQYYLRDQTLGCDGIIGSGKRVDRCGECGGDNTGCKIISGIFTKKTSKADYVYITEFPVGAGHINITEARNTRNYLALRLSANRRSIVNGNWSLDWSGDYKAAGSTVEYRKSNQPNIGENIYIKGPITEEIQLLLLAQTRNPGIYYSYTLPVPRHSYPLSQPPNGPAAPESPPYYHTGRSGYSERDDLPRYVGDSLGYGSLRRYPSSSQSQYQWKSIDTNQCSQSCGEGFKEISVVCVLEASQVTVTEENCRKSLRPEEKKIKCNTQPCAPEWEAGEWSSCSATCGRSTQTRSVTCKRRISANQVISVYAWNCESADKPSTVKMCSERDCYTWQESEWTECSAKCGAGSRSRKVHCVDSEGSRVDDDLCVLDKPRHVEKCYSTCEESWFTSNWNDKCMQDCTTGNQTRQIYCPADADSPAFSKKRSKCGDEPTTVQACATRPECRATGRWFAGEWATCIGDCKEAYQTRETVCMTKREQWNVVTYDNECAAEKRPNNKQKCRPMECDREESLWFTTEWSKCSVTCGEGYHRRQVKCLDANLKEATNCLEVTKPLTAKPCSKPECPKEEEQATLPPNCKNKYSSCQVVVQARLCKLAYYNNLCCASCSNEQ